MNFRDFSNKTICVTGVAGFIGFHLTKSWLEEGKTIIGIDNVNDYYDTDLKNARLNILKKYPNFSFHFGDVSDSVFIERILCNHVDIVIHLAAQAGVRYSLQNPRAYIDSNIVGFFNLLEICRNCHVEHLVFASSSSVYGNQSKIPFSEKDRTDAPVSLYAATKKSNELMAYTYSHLYRIPVTGLRFFTVYGPWGRPDMAYFKFTHNILNDIPIQVYNHGDMMRDFTYIDDIVQGISLVSQNPPIDHGVDAPYKLYNIGNNHPERLMDVIELLEKMLGKKAYKEFLPMQQGDVYQTYADIEALENEYGFHPMTSIEEGLREFTSWYMKYYL